MKSKFIVSVLCLFMLSMPLIAQRTVTNRLCVSCIPHEQYTVNANGDYNGLYKEWNRQGKLIKQCNYLNGDLHGSCIYYFTNGTIKEESTYYKGTMTSLTVYQYNDTNTKRRLTRTATWDKSGNILTDRRLLTDIREIEYNNGNEWIEYAGKLPNGRWRFNYPSYGDYSETYNSNDTLYVWDDRAKQRFLGKSIDGVFIRVYTKEEIMARKEEAIQDSIAYVKGREEEDRLYLMEEAIQDSIEQVKIEYNKLASLIIATSTSYKDLLTDGKYSTEYTFYSFLCKYIKKEKGTDSILCNMIMNVLGITDVKDLEIKAILLESNVTGFQATYINDGIAVTDKHDKANTRKFKSYYNVNSNFTANHNWNLEYTVPENILANYSKQQQLLDIILYCKEHNIVIK